MRCYQCVSIPEGRVLHDGARLCSVMLSHGQQGEIGTQKIPPEHEGEIPLCDGDWNKLPREVVESHSLEILKPTILLKPALGESALAGGWTR